MEFNEKLWEERFSETNRRLDRHRDSITDIRIALFGNGKKDASLVTQVRENTKFREEMEKLMNSIRTDILKRIAWAAVVLTVVLLGGFGSVIAIILSMINNIPK